MPDASIYLLYFTAADSEEAERISAQLLERRLIACANILSGATSLYRWNGALERAREAVVWAKTAQSHVHAAIEAVKALHSYEIPCVIALPVAEGNPDFLAWVETQSGAF